MIKGLSNALKAIQGTAQYSSRFGRTERAAPGGQFPPVAAASSPSTGDGDITATAGWIITALLKRPLTPPRPFSKMAGKDFNPRRSTDESMPRPRPARASRYANASAAEWAIPDKLYFRIGEVSELTETKSYVLRYWETEFPSLRPVKSPSGHRLYRRQDVEMVLRIKRLLYEQGFTIEGARRKLAEPAGALNEPKRPESSTLDGTQLKAIRRGLESILTMLSRRC